MPEQVVVPAGAGERLEWVDALRGLAALAVVMQHYVWSHVPRAVSTFADPGIFGVTAFFCISGFLIPYSVLKTRATVARFVVGRIFRLYPAYWVSVLLGAVVFSAGLKLTLVNLTMLQRFAGFDDIVGVYWTLQVEIMFYACMAALILWRRPRSGPLSVAATVFFLLGALALSLIRFTLGRKAPVAPLLGLSVMFCAKTYFHHVYHQFLSRRAMAVFGTLCFLGLCVGFTLAYARDWGFDENPYRFIISYGAGILAFLLAGRWKHPHPVALFLGRISYPVYLIHVPLKAWCDGLLPAASPVLVGVAGLALTVGLATALHHLVEMPGLRLGKRFVAAWARSPQVERREPAA